MLNFISKVNLELYRNNFRMIKKYNKYWVDIIRTVILTI